MLVYNKIIDSIYTVKQTKLKERYITFWGIDSILQEDVSNYVIYWGGQNWLFNDINEEYDVDI